MGLFNNYYGRSYSDRKPNTYNNTSRNNNNKFGGQQQQRRGVESWSGGSSATSSPEPIDFSVNDIVFEKRTVMMSGDSMAGRSQAATVNWRQNDIDFGRRSQLMGQQRGGQRQRNSVSSDDCSDSNSFPSPNQQHGQHHSGGYVNNNQAGRYNSSIEPANGQLGSSCSYGRQPGYNSKSSSSYGKQLGYNNGSSYGSQTPNYNGNHQMNSSYANGYNSYEMQPPTPGYSSYVGHQQPASGHSSYKSQGSPHQQVCNVFTISTVQCSLYAGSITVSPQQNSISFKILSLSSDKCKIVHVLCSK
jgi:hypothetical protein